MSPLVLYGDKVSVRVTKEFRQLVNISIAAGKFILIHPHYDLIREAMRLDMFEDELLEDFEVHNWQFEIGEVIAAAGFIPILEPEVDIHTPNKEAAEVILKKELIEHLKKLDPTYQVMIKVTIPDKDNFYEELMSYPNVVRIVALSGGYSRDEANEKLKKNHKLIASFSRALTEGLNVSQSDEEFNSMLDESIQSIYEASIQ